MRFELIVLTLFSFSLTKCQEVIILTDATFEKAIYEHELIMVKYFAPWCGHCKKAAPEFIKAAQIAHEEGIPCTFADLDTTENLIIKEKFNVSSVPTIILFIKGTAIEYNGGRETQKFLNFIHLQTHPLEVLRTKEQIKDKLEELDELSMFIFGGKESDVRRVGEMSAKILNKIKFYALEDNELLSAFEESGSTPRAILMKDYDQKKTVLMDSKYTEEGIKQFILDNSEHSVIPFSVAHLHSNILENGTAVGVILFLDGKNKSIEDEFSLVAFQNKGSQDAFWTADVNDVSSTMLSAHFRIDKTTLPQIEILYGNKTLRQIYRYKQDLNIYPFTSSGISSFYKDYKNGKIPRYLRSEPVLPHQEGPIRKIVGESYKKEIIQSGKDAIVYIHAPSCIPCKIVLYLYIYIYIIYIYIYIDHANL